MGPFDAMMKELDRTVLRLESAASDVSRGLRPLHEGLDTIESDVNNARVQLLGTRRVRQIMFTCTCTLTGNYRFSEVKISKTCLFVCLLM